MPYLSEALDEATSRLREAPFYMPSIRIIPIVLCGLLLLVTVPLCMADDASMTESHRIRLINRYFGAISVSTDGGDSWKLIGRVIRPLFGEYKAIQPKEFTASDWGEIGCVTATAVNAIHVKVAQLDPHAAIFSILPKELAPGGRSLASYYDQPSSLFVDMAAGTELFSGRWAPFVGSRFMLEDRLTRELEKPAEGYAPRPGDRVIFLCERKQPTLEEVVFENEFDGAVRACFSDGTSRLIARVLRPVTGTGRFGGTIYAGVGQLRANHPGVICVSTSPYGEVGGFQIVPAVHASDPHLPYVRTVPAWMVIGPLGLPGKSMLEGSAPLFSGSLRPKAWELFVRRRGEDKLHPVAAIAGKKLSSLLNVTHIALRRCASSGQEK